MALTKENVYLDIGSERVNIITPWDRCLLLSFVCLLFCFVFVSRKAVFLEESQGARRLLSKKCWVPSS